MPESDGAPRVLYLTTRDVERPRTGADNRAAFLLDGIDRRFAVDRVAFDRSDGQRDTSRRANAVPYPRSELLAIVSLRFAVATVRAMRRESYDAVVVSGIGAVTYGILAVLLGRLPLIFDDHNVEAELAREASWPRYLVVSVLERSACWLATVVVVPTEETRSGVDAWAGGTTAIVTNGFDAETFTPHGHAVGGAGVRLLYFGNYRYEPNREAVTYIADVLCPTLQAADVEAQIALAGPGGDRIPAGHLAQDRIELLGFVDDLPATIRGADLVIVPLRTGSGSRLKIIESLACGTPVISTPLGAAGWPTEWSNLIVTDLDDFAECTMRCLDTVEFDESELATYHEYSWQTQSARFADLVERVLADGGQVTAPP